MYLFSPPFVEVGGGFFKEMPCCHSGEGFGSPLTAWSIYEHPKKMKNQY